MIYGAKSSGGEFSFFYRIWSQVRHKAQELSGLQVRLPSRVQITALDNHPWVGGCPF